MLKNRIFLKIVSWLIIILVFTVVWICPLLSYAQEASTDSPAGDLLTVVLKIVCAILSVLGSVLITKAISYVEGKAKIDIPTATEKMLFDWADQAVGFAYEKAHQLIQSEGKTMNGSDKLNIAIKFVMDLVAKYNIEGVVEEKLKDYINSKLGMKRLADSNIVPPFSDPYSAVIVAK